MKTLSFTVRLSAMLACLGLPVISHAKSGIIPSPAGSQSEFHVEVGFTYASGMNNVINQMKKNFGLEDDSSFLVGLKISAYAKSSNGFAIGGGIGPCQYFRVQTYRPSHRNHSRNEYNHDNYYDNDYHYSTDDDETSYVIPVFADLRYYFPRNELLTPYVRAGIAYPISGGDHLSAGTPGVIGAIGAQFLEKRYFALGVEAGFDDSRVQVKSGPFHPKDKVRPTEFTLTIFAAF